MKKASERLGVKIVGGLKEISTPWAGTSLLVDLFRKLEMDQLANQLRWSPEFRQVAKSVFCL